MSNTHFPPVLTDLNAFKQKYLTFIGPCIANIFAEYNQQDATFHIYLFLQDALHVERLAEINKCETLHLVGCTLLLNKNNYSVVLVISQFENRSTDLDKLLHLRFLHRFVVGRTCVTVIWNQS